MATVQATPAFTPYLTHEKQQEIDLAEQKYLAPCNLKKHPGGLFQTLCVTMFF